MNGSSPHRKDFPFGKILVPWSKPHEKMCKLAAYGKTSPEPIACISLTVRRYLTPGTTEKTVEQIQPTLKEDAVLQKKRCSQGFLPCSFQALINLSKVSL